MLLSNNSVIEDFKAALDFFFRRRPTLQSIMWHTENIAAGKRFTVPQGKIYEVYVNQSSGQGIWGLNGVLFALESINLAGCWLPLSYALESVTEWTVAGAVYSSSSLETMYTMSPKGWILSEGDYITEENGYPFQVRWRDVTHRQ